MDDRSIMARLAAGDQSAAADLYDRYGRQVFSLAFRMVGEMNAAEDVTQEVFARVWRHAARFDPERGQAGSWILHIAHTCAVDVIRARRRAAPGSLDALRDQPDVASDPAADAETAVLSAQVRCALMRLPPEQRQAVELAYYNAMTQQEIATFLGIPLGTVKSRVRLALEGLRQFLLMPRRKEVESGVRMPPHA